MLVIDEYLAVDVMLGDWPAGLPDDDIIGLPASRHFRLLQRIHQPGTGQLTGILDRLPEPDRHAMRTPRSSRSSTPARCSTRPPPSAPATAPAGCSSSRPSPRASPTATSSGSAPNETSATASPTSPPTSTSPSTSPAPPDPGGLPSSPAGSPASCFRRQPGRRAVAGGELWVHEAGEPLGCEPVAGCDGAVAVAFPVVVDRQRVRWHGAGSPAMTTTYAFRPGPRPAGPIQPPPPGGVPVAA